MSLTPVLDQRSPTVSSGRERSAMRSQPTRVARIVVGLLITAIGVVGAVRTFDPVQLTAAQLAFLLTTVLGVAITRLHIRD